MTSEIVNRGQSQLIFNDILKILVVSHQALLIIEFVGKMEQESVLKFAGWSLEGLCVGFLVHAEEKIAASQIHCACYTLLLTNNE